MKKYLRTDYLIAVGIGFFVGGTILATGTVWTDVKGSGGTISQQNWDDLTSKLSDCQTVNDTDCFLKSSSNYALYDTVLAYGDFQSNPGESCYDVMNNRSDIDGTDSNDNGLYWIDTNGGDTADAFQVYCNMSIDGGGWTLVARDKLSDKTLDLGSAPDWPTSVGGTISGDGDYIINNGVVELFKKGSNFEYLINTSGDYSDSRYIICDQTSSILNLTAPNSNEQACNRYDNGNLDNSDLANRGYGISIHSGNSDGNYRFIAFWNSTGAAGQWRQGSLFCANEGATACRNWTEVPATLGVNGSGEKVYTLISRENYPTRDSSYTTRILAR